MRPTFLGFEAGRKGLAVAQKGLDVTGQNLMNSNTPGYTRQRIDQVSVSAYGYTSRFAGNRVDFAGQGVAITGVAQIRNSYLDRRFREEFTDYYGYNQKVSILGDIANVVDQYSDPNGGGLFTALNTMSQALHGLTDDKSTNRSSLNIFRTAVQGMVQTLNDYSTKLDQVAEQHKYDLEVSVKDVNSLLAKIAGLNKQIFNEVALNPGDADVYVPNELMDERNLLLDELSRYGNLDVIAEMDGTVTVKMGGHEVVSGDRYDILNSTRHTGGTMSLSWNSKGTQASFSSGALKSAVDMINGRGPDLQSSYESPEKGVLYYKDRIDTLARTFASVMNKALPSGLDDEGNPIDNTFKTLVSSTTGGQVTAANITISDEWAEDLLYAFPNRDSTNNSEWFLKLNNLLMKDKTTEFVTFDQSFVGSFEEFIMDLSTTISSEEEFYQGRMDATGAVADSLMNERDSISSVQKDEETSNMMMYQKSFQAVSRLITAMDEMLDVVINQMGLVGR